MEDKEKYSLIDLPTETIARILGYLGLSDLHNAKLTCKKLRNVINIPIKVCSLSERDFYTLPIRVIARDVDFDDKTIFLELTGYGERFARDDWESNNGPVEDQDLLQKFESLADNLGTDGTLVIKPKVGNGGQFLCFFRDLIRSAKVKRTIVLQGYTFKDDLEMAVFATMCTYFHQRLELRNCRKGRNSLPQVESFLQGFAKRTHSCMLGRSVDITFSRRSGEENDDADIFGRIGYQPPNDGSLVRGFLLSLAVDPDSKISNIALKPRLGSDTFMDKDHSFVTAIEVKISLVRDIQDQANA